MDELMQNWVNEPCEACGRMEQDCICLDYEVPEEYIEGDEDLDEIC